MIPEITSDSIYSALTSEDVILEDCANVKWGSPHLIVQSVYPIMH